MPNERDPLVTLAIVKACSEKAEKDARTKAMPGKYKIESLVRLCGTISVGEDTTATKPAELKEWDIIAMLASKVNAATLKAVAKEVIEAYREKRAVEGVEEAKLAVAAVVAEMKEETRSIRKGQVKYVGDVEVMDQKIALCL